jgi:multicomponent Na+:H+ antiporter subunit E
MMSANTPATARPVGAPEWRGWARRIGLFAALWWILTDGVAASWMIGAPIVLLAAWLSRSLWADPPLSLLGVARFVPFFAYQSLAGATDVAKRALQPRMPLYPGVVRHRLRLPPGVARVSLANVVSMLAGTLSADLEGDELVIHALDVRNDLHAMVEDLEPRIAAVFNLPLEKLPHKEGGQ